MPKDNIAQAIHSKLTDALSPTFLEVLNESSGHNVPPDSETHFKITAVCNDFDVLSRVQRHQRVYQVLKQELEGEVHALALHLFAPKEWSGSSPVSPKCLGGEK